MKYLLSILLLCAAQVASAQSETETPAPGSPLRVALMDAVRTAVEPELEQHVVFKIDQLKVKNGWAFMRGVPQLPDGGAVDYKKTKYQAAIREGMFDNNICALIHKKTNGEWWVVEFKLGSTDVPWVTWPAQYKAPKSIFE